MKFSAATLLSMVLITILLLYAMSKGIDGLMLAGGIAIIAGLGGFIGGKKLLKK